MSKARAFKISKPTFNRTRMHFYSENFPISDYLVIVIDKIFSHIQSPNTESRSMIISSSEPDNA